MKAVLEAMVCEGKRMSCRPRVIAGKRLLTYYYMTMALLDHLGQESLRRVVMRLDVDVIRSATRMIRA